jgi:hypothetical protein
MQAAVGLEGAWGDGSVAMFTLHKTKTKTKNGSGQGAKDLRLELGVVELMFFRPTNVAVKGTVLLKASVSQ